MPLTDEEQTQLTALVEKAAADGVQLPGFVPVDVLKGRLADKDRARESAVAEAQARQAEIERAHSEALAKLQEYEDRGKSADQKIADELAKERLRVTAESTARKAAEERAQQTEERLRRTELHNRLATIVSGSENPRHSIAALLMDHPGIGLEDDGAGGYKMSLTRDGLPVERPEEALGEWFKTQKHLRAKSGTEVPIGSGRGASPPAKNATDGMTDAQLFALAVRRGVTST